MTFESPLPKQVLPVAEQFPTPTHTTTCSPKIQMSGKTTVSELLASFSPVSQSKKSPQSWVSPSTFPIVMSEKRTTRRKERVSYLISDDSDSPESESVGDSAFSNPQTPGRDVRQKFEEESDIELDIKPAKTPPPRISLAGHSLRQHQDLHLSLRAQENGDKGRVKKRRVSKKAPRKSLAGPNSNLSPLPRTARNQIRDKIATETARKRGNFFVAKKNYFLPLLPDNNHISRLAEERSHGQDGETDLTVPYEALEHQPEGYALLCSIMRLQLIY